MIQLSLTTLLFKISQPAESYSSEGGMDVEKRESEAVQAAMGPQRLARDGDYGFCGYGDASPAIGGGIPVFFWFEDGPAMLDFLNASKRGLIR